MERKIIYSSGVHLVLKRLISRSSTRRLGFLEKYEGYHSLVTFEGNRGYGKVGQMGFSVPVRHYQTFVAAVKDLGVPELVRRKTRRTSRTSSWIWTPAWPIKSDWNKRILEVLDQVSGKIGEVL